MTETRIQRKHETQEGVGMASGVLNAFAIPVDPEGLDHLARTCQSRNCVLIGEQSHGTQEFYHYRAELAKRLIRAAKESERHRIFIVLECAFVDSILMNDYITSKTDMLLFDDAFPRWMWDNQVMRELFAWCRAWNTANAGSLQVEVVGMDLYKPAPRVSMSSQQVIDAGLYNSRTTYITSLVAEAHREYRASNNSWNVRDQHMFNVLEYIFMCNPDCQCIVMAHNSHCLDYRATDHQDRGEISVGQLCREHFDAYIVMQSTYSGTVRAAAEWDEADQVWEIERPASNSISYMLHSVELEAFVLDLDKDLEVRRIFNVPHSSRAIGVVYREGQEGLSHYFESIHSLACHAIIHVDHTSALRI